MTAIKKKLNPKHITLILLTLTAIGFYMLDRYSLFTHDDCCYAFFVKPTQENYLAIIDDNYHPQPIETFTDVIKSQANFYVNTNGRFLVHVIAQTACSFTTRSQFAVANTIVFMLLVWIMHILIMRNGTTTWQRHLKYVLLTVVAIWFIFASKETVLWGNIANVTNYLWVSVPVLWLLRLIEKHNIKTDEDAGWGSVVAIFVFSLITSSLQESFTIGMSVALALYFLTNRRFFFSRWHRAMLAGFVIGATICIFSPGNFNRLEEYRTFSYTFVVFLFLTPTFVLLALSIAYGMTRNRKNTTEFIMNNQLWFTTIVVSIVFDLLVAFTNRTQITVINLFSFILLFRYWGLDENLKTIKRAVKPVICASTILMLITYIPVYKLRKDINTAYNQMLTRALNSKDGTVVNKEYEHLAYTIEKSVILKNYVAAFMFTGNDVCKRQFSTWLTRGKDNHLIKTLLPLTPQEISSGCTSDNLIGENVYQLADDYVVVVTDEEKKCEDVTLHAQMDDLASLLLYDNYTTPQSSEHIKIGNKHYYVFAHKPKIKKILSL